MNGGTLTLTDCTLSGNVDSGWFSGIVVGSGEMKIKNTILANSSLGANLAVAEVDDPGTITSYGYNLCTDNGGGFLTTAAHDQINTDPMLDDLADNGGPTWTCALGAGSLAIDASDSTDIAGNLVRTDQRGIARPLGSANDIGAYEAEVAANHPPVLTEPTSPLSGVVGTPVTFTATARTLTRATRSPSEGERGGSGTGGEGLSVVDVASTAGVRPLKISRPSWFRGALHSTLVMEGLRGSSAGGFGALIPEPSSEGSGFG